MRGTIETVAGRLAGAAVLVIYEVDLTSDARALVSSRIKGIKVQYPGGPLLLTPDEARQLAVTILGALDTIDPEAVVNR